MKGILRKQCHSKQHPLVTAVLANHSPGIPAGRSGAVCLAAQPRLLQSKNKSLASDAVLAESITVPADSFTSTAPQQRFLQSILCFRRAAGPDVTADIQVIPCNLFCFRRGKSFGSSKQREPFREETLNIPVHFADQHLQSCTKLSLTTGLLLQDLPLLSSSPLSPVECRVCISTCSDQCKP